MNPPGASSDGLADASRLMDAAAHPAGMHRMRTAIGFALVGVSGIVVNQVLLWGQVHLLGIFYLFAAIVATQGSTVWNFTLTELWVFRGRSSRLGLPYRFVAFAAVNNVALLVRIPLLALLTEALHLHYLVSNLLTLALLFVVRFSLSDQLIWRPAVASRAASPAASDSIGPAEARPAAPAKGTIRNRPFAHYYSVHGLASLASDVRLPELDYFHVDALASRADIEVRVGEVGAKPRRRIEVIESPGVMQYQEHLGRMGANFRVEIFDRVKILVTPLLSGSPHVVYTNIIEALLRFVLASRDLALLHSATVVLGGQGVMLSAHTDTGKTATILRMLRERGGVFLSDDMTIVSPDAHVFSYPKPLTISHHTLGAIDGVLRSRTERAVLRVKSSVHSKKGRGAGMRLARLNLPIMSINAVTQAVIPPPKYTVQSLVPCTLGATTDVRRLFLIARGPRLNEAVGQDEALRALIENTDDAYGFPPFQRLAPSIVLDGETYPYLRRKERAIIRQMLSRIRVERIVRDDFSWADDIPGYLLDDDKPGYWPGSAACPEGLCA